MPLICIRFAFDILKCLPTRLIISPSARTEESKLANTEISSPPRAKTAANPSGACRRLYRFAIESIILGKFIAGALDSAASTEEPTHSRWPRNGGPTTAHGAAKHFLNGAVVQHLLADDDGDGTQTWRCPTTSSMSRWVGFRALPMDMRGRTCQLTPRAHANVLSYAEPYLSSAVKFSSAELPRMPPKWRWARGWTR